MMDQKTIDSFFSSYELFEKDKVSRYDSNNIINYYRVINYLCTLGNVEKMYIPPMINQKKNIIENQNLFEELMISDLNIKNNQKILDIGCGRGRIACHIAKLTGANIEGINIDISQIISARSYAIEMNLHNKTKFMVANYNDILPFPDQYFDTIYQIQAFTYAENIDKLFSEIYRVMKPGGRFSWLDWVILENFDPNNDVHLKTLNGTKAIIGGVLTELPSFWIESMKKSGFNIVKNYIPSINGIQYPLIEKEVKYFTNFEKIVSFLVKIKLIPKHIKLLLSRFNKYGDDFIFADKNKLCSTTYYIILEKPLY